MPAEASLLEIAGFPILAILGMAFVLIPLVFKSRSQQQNAQEQEDIAIQTNLNQSLFAENLKQLEEQHNNKEITDATFEKLKLELEKQLQQDQQIRTNEGFSLSANTVRWTMIGSTIALPVLAFVFYQQWGAYPDLEIYQTNIQKVRMQERGANDEEMRALNKQLKDLLELRVEQREENLHNQFLLARTYAELEDYRSSMEAYQAILDQRPQSPDVVGEMAQVMYLAAGSQFTAEVKEMFDQAVAMSPQNVRIISFAGLSAYQSGAYQAALGYWQRAVALSEPGSQQFQYMNQALLETRRQLEAAGLEVADNTAEIAADTPQYKINIVLGEGIDIDPAYRVFVYAKAWKGPPMPLAIRDMKVADLPQTITLDESMGIPGMSGMAMSQFPELELVARVSRTGTATAQPGDWQASIGPVSQGETEEVYQLVIASQIP